MPRSIATRARASEPVTMSSREIAELTEVRHDSVKRTIDSLRDRGVVGLPQTVEYLDSLGRPATEYHLGKRDSLVVVARVSPEYTARVIDRWQELEDEVHKPKPVLLNPPKVFGDYMKVAKLLGLDNNVSAISANQATFKLTGVNVLVLLGHTALDNPEQTLYYTPTELGAMQTPPLSPQKINRKLAELGLQTHTNTKFGGTWVPTPAAKGLHRVLDTGKSHNSGAMVQQIKWAKAALEPIA